MKTERKAFSAELKASKDKPGEFEGIVSVFGNIDHGGDRVLPGAFLEVISSGKMPPIFWNHAWSLGPVGVTLSWEEREKGLWVHGKLFLDVGSDLVKRIHAAMLAGQVREFSFAYDTLETRRIQEGSIDVREIVKFERIYEVGPVVAGMNPDTELIQVAGLLGGGKATDLTPVADQLHALAVTAGAKCDHVEPPKTEVEPGDTGATVTAEMAALLVRVPEEG